MSHSIQTLGDAVAEFQSRLASVGLPPLDVSYMSKSDEAYTHFPFGHVQIGMFEPHEAPAAMSHEWVHSTKRIPHMMAYTAGLQALAEQDANFTSGALLAILGYPIDPAIKAVNRIRQKNSPGDAQLATNLMRAGYQTATMMGAQAAMKGLAGVQRTAPAIKPPQCGSETRGFANAHPWPGYTPYDASALGKDAEFLVSVRCTRDTTDTFRLLGELEKQHGTLPAEFRDHAVKRAYWRELHGTLFSAARSQKIADLHLERAHAIASTGVEYMGRQLFGGFHLADADRRALFGLYGLEMSGAEYREEEPAKARDVVQELLKPAETAEEMIARLKDL